MKKQHQKERKRRFSCVLLPGVLACDPSRSVVLRGVLRCRVSNTPRFASVRCDFSSTAPLIKNGTAILPRVYESRPDQRAVASDESTAAGAYSTEHRKSTLGGESGGINTQRHTEAHRGIIVDLKEEKLMN